MVLPVIKSNLGFSTFNKISTIGESGVPLTTISPLLIPPISKEIGIKLFKFSNLKFEAFPRSSISPYLNLFF